MSEAVGSPGQASTRLTRFRVDCQPTGSYPETGFWEAALHSTDLSIQIVNDKGRSHQQSEGRLLKGIEYSADKAICAELPKLQIF